MSPKTETADFLKKFYIVSCIASDDFKQSRAALYKYSSNNLEFIDSAEITHLEWLATQATYLQKHVQKYEGNITLLDENCKNVEAKIAEELSTYMAANINGLLNWNNIPRNEIAAIGVQGFPLYQGKNSEGRHCLTTLSAPYDLANYTEYYVGYNNNYFKHPVASLNIPVCHGFVSDYIDKKSDITSLGDVVKKLDDAGYITEHSPSAQKHVKNDLIALLTLYRLTKTPLFSDGIVSGLVEMPLSPHNNIAQQMIETHHFKKERLAFTQTIFQSFKKLYSRASV